MTNRSLCHWTLLKLLLGWGCKAHLPSASSSSRRRGHSGLGERRYHPECPASRSPPSCTYQERLPKETSRMHPVLPYPAQLPPHWPVPCARRVSEFFTLALRLGCVAVEKIVISPAGIRALILPSVVTAAKPTGQRLNRELCKSFSATTDTEHQCFYRSYTRQSFMASFSKLMVQYFLYFLGNLWWRGVKTIAQVQAQGEVNVSC